MNIEEAINFLKKKGYRIIKESNYFRLYNKDGMQQ